MDEQAAPSFDYLRFVRRLLLNRWKLIVSAFLAISLPALIWVFFFAEKTYEATATVFFESGKEEPVFLRGLLGGQDASALNLVLLRSRSLAAAVVDSLPREAREELLKKTLQPDTFLAIQNTIRRLLGQEVVVYSPQEMAVRELQESRMTFSPTKEGTVLVTATSFSPRVATDLANSYVDVLLARSGAQSREQARSARELLESMLAQSRNAQQEAEENLRKFQGSATELKIPDQTRLQLGKLAEIEGVLAEIQVNKEIAQAKLAAIRGGAEPGPAAPSDPAVLLLRERLVQAQTRYATLSERFTDEHPLVVSAKADVDDVEQRVRAALKGRPMPAPAAGLARGAGDRAALGKQMADLEFEMTSLGAREHALNGRAAKLKTSLSAMSDKEMDYARTLRVMESQRNLVGILTDKLNSARMSEQTQLRHIRVIDQASQPSSPSAKRLLKILMGGVAGGLGLGLGLAALLEMSHAVVETEEDVVRITGYPVLGSIPIVAGAMSRPAVSPVTRKPGPVNFLQDDDALSLPLEACRSVRTTLEFQDPDRKFKTLVVTSASAGEGKTSMLLNLGWVFWETGRRILLIDGDLRRPSLHQPLGIPNENGLAELLREHADWNEGRRTIREGLDFIPSGIEPSNPGPLLNSRFMTQLMTEARRHADVILIDSPPVLAVSDNLTLASLADGIVFVVRSGVTRRRNLLRAKAQLEKVRGRVLGVIVNGLSPRETRRYYAEYTSYVRVEPPARESRLGVLKRMARPRWPGRSTREQNGEGSWAPGLEVPVEEPRRSLLKRMFLPRWLHVLWIPFRWIPFRWLRPRWPRRRPPAQNGEGS